MTKKEKKQTKTKQGKVDQLAEMKDLLQRTQANFENFRKQTDKRIEEIRTMAARDIITQVLPVIDNFNFALKNVNKTNGNSDFIDGVEMIYSQMNTILKDAGVKEIKTKNEKFNPTYHEALMKMESNLPEGTIVEEFQKGFKIGDRVIRHARVKISAGKKMTIKTNNINLEE